MKALSLTQPWATLVQRKVKRLETRSWYTSYRGELVIHAAKKFPADFKDLCFDSAFRDGLGSRYPHDLPLGAGLCVVRLIACVNTSELEKLEKIGFLFELDDEEIFGDLCPGRYAWALEHVRDLPEPIPAKGALGLWEWKEDVR